MLLGRHIFVWLNIIFIFTELHAGNRRVFLFFLQRLSFDACRTPKSVNALRTRVVDVSRNTVWPRPRLVRGFR